MNSSKYAFQAGLFILLSIAGAIFLIARVAESRGTPTDAKTYTAVFAAGKDTAGLAPGAEVRLMGVKVGRVESVRIVTPTKPEEDAAVHVDFIVGNGVELRDTGAKIELQTAVTGGAWLNIMSVGTGAALADGGTVQATSADLVSVVKGVSDEMQTTLAAVRTELDSVGGEMQATLAAVREELDTVGDELVQTTEAVETTAESTTKLIDRIDDQIEALLKESTAVMTDIRGVFGDSGDDIRTTLAKLKTLTTSLDEKVPLALDQVNGLVRNTGSMVRKADKSIEGVDKLIDELTGTAKEARSLISDNRDEIDRTLASARRSVDELEGMVDDLRANPSRLIWPPDEKDLKNQELYGAARSYAKAAEDLESAASKLLAASKNKDTDPEKLEALRKDLLKQFKHFDKLQDEVWKRFEK